MRRSCLAAFVLVTAISAGATEPAAPAIAVVVGRNSVVTGVTRDELRDVYLRRQRLWPNGTGAIPVNLPAGSPVREEFSRLVLGRSSQDLVAHWNARYFEGVRPPVVVPSVAAMRAYLNAEPAAIGYLPLDEVGDGCRPLLTLRPSQ